MSLIWMIVAGLMAGAVAKLLMPKFAAGGLFLLGVGGSIIAGLMQYSEGFSIGFFTPLAGAAVLLVIFAFTARPPAVESAMDREDREDIRRAA
jgi:uncharacterized membrane protein YeaQ/YmgE (transglycosylase-associated protein family)